MFRPVSRHSSEVRISGRGDPSLVGLDICGGTNGGATYQHQDWLTAVGTNRWRALNTFKLVELGELLIRQKSYRAQHNFVSRSFHRSDSTTPSFTFSSEEQVVVREKGGQRRDLAVAQSLPGFGHAVAAK
jgi:hypothetical protein